MGRPPKQSGRHISSLSPSTHPHLSLTFTSCSGGPAHAPLLHRFPILFALFGFPEGTVDLHPTRGTHAVWACLIPGCRHVFQILFRKNRAARSQVRWRRAERVALFWAGWLLKTIVQYKISLYQFYCHYCCFNIKHFFTLTVYWLILHVHMLYNKPYLMSPKCLSI